MKAVKYALTYARCQILMATARNKQKGKPIGNNTRLYETRDNRYYSVELHGNEIMQIHRDGYVIDSCGWKSVTTKARLNTYLPDEFVIRQHQFYWWVYSMPEYKEDKWGNVSEFRNGMFLHLNGKVYGSLSAWLDEKWGYDKWGYDKHEEVVG